MRELQKGRGTDREEKVREILGVRKTGERYREKKNEKER